MYPYMYTLIHIGYVQTEYKIWELRWLNAESEHCPMPTMLWDIEFHNCYVNFQLLEKARTHSIILFASRVKFHLIDSYCSECLIPQC